jgi:hypothetical protein
MPIVYNEAEIACIQELSQRFENGTTRVGTKGDEYFYDADGLKAEFLPILTILKEHGIISNVTHTHRGKFAVFTITSEAARVAREIAILRKEEEGNKDIVEQFRKSIRRHPITGWGLIAFLAIGFLLTLANQLVSLLKALGLF